MLVELEDASVVRADTFENTIAVKQTVIEHRHRRLALGHQPAIQIDPSYSAAGNQVWAIGFTGDLTDNSGATSDVDNIAHGLSLHATDDHIYAYGSIGNGSTRIYIPQNFTGVVFQVKVTATNVTLEYDANLSSYDYNVRLVYVPA